MTEEVKPKLSIIVPVYNVEKYLGGCLDSLLNQTLKDIDIICVDDGSTDNSAQILKEYAEKDKRIRIITKKNGGLSSARNAGLELVTTEFVTFVDSDDYLEPNAYEIAISKMTDDIDFVHFGIQTVGETAEQTKKEDDEYYTIKYAGKKEITTDLMLEVDVSSCNKVFRKSILDKYNIRFPDGLRHEDAYFFNIYALNSRYCFYIQDKFYKYIRHEGSIMAQVFSNKPGHSIDHLSIAVRIYDYMNNHNLFYAYKHYFGVIFFAYFDFAMRYENTKIGKRAIYNLAINFLKDNYISFFEYADLKMLEQRLRKRLWENTVKKSLFGLMRTKFKDKNILYIFCGIPILRVKYCEHKTRYYPLSLFCLFEKTRRAEKISVLMPIYNAEKYLHESIDSILNQTYQNFEFIIINDGSTDGSADIVRSYKDPRIIFVDNPKNSGLVAVLNQGLDMAQGEFIARMDADDISLQSRLEKQIKFMKKHKDVGICGTFFHIFGNQINRIEKKKLLPSLKDMLKTSPVGHPTVMMRKSVLNKYHLRYDPRYKYAEDYELWTRAIKYTKIANLKDVLLNYRWSGDNVSITHNSEQLQTSEIIKQKIRRKIGRTSSLYHMILDDNQLLNCLYGLGEFAYMPNSGNIGDMVIASATLQWFDKNKFNYKRVKENENPSMFVYGGGGAWTHDYIQYMGPVMNIMKSAKKVVILPSSFDNVPEFIDILDERFTVFCRDKKSFDYLIAQNTKANILLDHDMALRMQRIPDTLFFVPKRFRKNRRILNRKLSKLPKTVNMFREDCESCGNHETDIDLSDKFGWFSPYESRKIIDFAAHTMFSSVKNFDLIRTDRLHVGIAAILLGVDVELYDNSYGKIGNVFRNSLSHLANVSMPENKIEE